MHNSSVALYSQASRVTTSYWLPQVPETDIKEEVQRNLAEPEDNEKYISVSINDYMYIMYIKGPAIQLGLSPAQIV